jgi:L-proline amide hydrolase
MQLIFSRWGRSRIRLVGSLRNYNAIEEAKNISAPTLLLTGQHDYMTEAMMEPWSQVIPEVEWKILENSSHMGHLEEPERYVKHLKDFLLPGYDRFVKVPTHPNITG